MADSEIGRLIIRLVATTGELTTNLREAEGLVSSFKGKMKNILGGISLVGAGWGLEKIVKDSIDAAAALSKLGEKVGVPTAEISKFAAAADHVGLSQESLATGIKFLSRNILDATRGIGDTKSVFDSLNVSFQDAQGNIRPTADILLDLADVFSKLEGDAARTALAVKLFGRGGIEMVPLLVKGRDTIQDWIAHAQKMGAVIDEDMGQKARKFNLTLKEINDAVDGVKIAFSFALLPTLQSAAKTVQSLAEDFNSLRNSMEDIVGVVKTTGLVVAAVLVGKVAAGLMTAAAAGTGFVAMLASIGAVIAGIVASPVAWLVVGLITLYNAYKYLTAGTQEAEAAQEAYRESIKKFDAAQSAHQIAAYTKYIQDLTDYIKRLRAQFDEKIEAEDFINAADWSSDIGTLTKKLEEARVTLGLLKKEVTEKKKAAAIPDTEIVKELKNRVAELNAEYVSMEDSVEGARQKLAAWYAKLTEGKGKLPEYETAMEKVRSAHERLVKAQEGMKQGMAWTQGELKNQIAYWDNYQADLEKEYERGRAGIEDYYNERVRVIREKMKEEISALEKERDTLGTPRERVIAINLEIKAKTAGLDTAVNRELDAGKKAVDAFNQSIRAGELQQLVDANAVDLEIMMQQFGAGLLSIRQFFEDRRRIIQEEAAKEIANIQASIFEGMDPKKQQDAVNEIARIRAKAGLDQIKLTKEEAVENRKSVLDAIGLAKTLYTVRAEGKKDDIEAMKLQHAAELEELQSRDLQEIAQLSDYLGKVEETQMGFAEKRQQMEELYAQLTLRREKRVMDQQVAIRAAGYANYAQTLGLLGTFIGNLYEASGQKAKAFFYAQKAISIAMAIVDTYAAANKAMGQLGIFGIPQSAIIMALGMANVALMSAMTIKGMKAGGPVTRGGGQRDDVPAMLMRGEYVIPKRAVDYYGVDTFEAIRRMLIRKDAFPKISGLRALTPSFAFATGGMVAGGLEPRDRTPQEITVNNTWVFSHPDMKGEILKNQSLIEGMVARGFAQAGIIRDASRRYR